MVPDEEDFEELRRRLMRLEMVVAAVVAGSGADRSDEALYLLTRLFRDGRRRGRFGDDHEFEFIIERLLDLRSPSRTRVDGDSVRGLRDRIANLESAQQAITESLTEAKRDLSSRIERLSEDTVSLSTETHALS